MMGSGLMAFVFFITVEYLSSFNLIGTINFFSDHKKDKKIDIRNSKIIHLIPRHAQHFFRSSSDPVPYFDGTVFKITYICAVVNLVHLIISMLLLILLIVLYIVGIDQIILLTIGLIYSVILSLIPGCVFKVISYRKEKEYKKREKEEGMNFN